jgi:hypothetical protein
MGLLDNLGDLANQLASGAASSGDVHNAFDQLTKAVPQGAIADGLSHAFNSDKTPPFGEMLSQIFNQSSPEQKAGILNQISSALGPGGLSQVLSGAGLGSLAAAVASGGNVTPAQAGQVTPDQAQVIAQNAQKKNPSIVDVASSFYAQHPTLVKAIGAGALALLVSKVSQARR